MVSKKGWIMTIFIIATVMVIMALAFHSLGTGGEKAGTPSKDDENFLDSVMDYIKRNHPDAAVSIDEPSEIAWSEASSQDLDGYSSSVYTGDGWTVTIGSAVTAKPPEVEVRAENKNEGIAWIGTVRDGKISETSYTH